MQICLENIYHVRYTMKIFNTLIREYYWNDN